MCLWILPRLTDSYSIKSALLQYQKSLRDEFGDIIQFLAKQNKENEIQQLIKKTQTEGLNEAERINLQEMLKERHQSITPTIKTNTE